MRRLLEADMKRVVAKVLPWIFLVAACVYVAADLKIGIGSAPDRVFFFLEKIERHNQIVLLIAGFAALIGIYADEFKSMSMITVIGRGISREKFVLAKFLDTCILALQIEILTVVYVMILKAVFGVSLTALETEHLVLVFIMGYIETIASVSVAAIFYFLSENAAIGMFAYIIGNGRIGNNKFSPGRFRARAAVCTCGTGSLRLLCRAHYCSDIQEKGTELLSGLHERIGGRYGKYFRTRVYNLPQKVRQI